MERSLPQLEDVFWAVADEVRGQILTMLRGNEMCACKILEHFDMRQPTLSHHMKILCDAQLVTSRRDGRWVRYRLNQPVIQELIDALAALQEDASGVYVYTGYNQRAGQLTDPVFVTTGDSDGEKVEILSGLAAGDSLYYRYASGLEYTFQR